MKRLSRGCYDKFHRCPGWNGGGPRFARRVRCNNGHIKCYKTRLWRWKFLACDTCNVVVWPYMTRYLSVPYLRDELTRPYSPRKLEFQADTRLGLLWEATLCQLGVHSPKSRQQRKFNGGNTCWLCRYCRLIVRYDNAD